MISAFNAPDLFWLVDSRRLLREATLTDGGGDIVVLRPWFWTSSRSAGIFDGHRGRGVFLPAAFDTFNEWIGPSTEFAEAHFLFLSS